MVARNFDQWTSTSCACVGRERGRQPCTVSGGYGGAAGLVGYRL